MSNRLIRAVSGDGVDRRGFLECMAWAGTGLVWTFAGGVAGSRLIEAEPGPLSGFTFAQISDSHIGFNKAANPDVAATLEEAVAKLNALPVRPDFVLHTGDISHLSKEAEFDTVDQILKGVKTGGLFFVPGEHDLLVEDGKTYRERYAKQAQSGGWYSFDHKGAHFIGLVNVQNLKAGGMGALGDAQLEWLEADLKGRGASTPIVVFAHIPLWSVYPEWGWGTEDSARALTLLKRFGSVTVLNGHIHQTMQKVEGNLTFHTATSTAFPQPKPGAAPSPGPMTVPAGELRKLLGLTTLNYAAAARSLAIVDTQLAGEGEQASVHIDNFSFSPGETKVPVGAKVTWTNHDDIPHNVVSATKEFSSPVLDTNENYSFTFPKAGEYSYFCSMHPHMTGRVVVS